MGKRFKLYRRVSILCAGFAVAIGFFASAGQSQLPFTGNSRRVMPRAPVPPPTTARPRENIPMFDPNAAFRNRLPVQLQPDTGGGGGAIGGAGGIGGFGGAGGFAGSVNTGAAGAGGFGGVGFGITNRAPVSNVFIPSRSFQNRRLTGKQFGFGGTSLNQYKPIYHGKGLGVYGGKPAMTGATN